MTHFGAGPVRPHLDEERLSAVVDGLAEPHEAAHASTCPECAAHLSAWQAALARLASLPAPRPSPVHRDAAVNAALAAAGAARGSPGALVPEVGQRSQVGFRRLPFAWVAGLAAVALVVAGLAFALVQGRPSSSSKSTASGASAGAAARPAPATSVSPAAGALSPTQGAAPSAAAAPPAALAPPGTSGSLGRFDTVAALVAVLRQAVIPTGSGAGNSSTINPAPLSCLAEAAGDAQLAGNPAPVFHASLDYRGALSEVFVFPQLSGHVAVVVRSDTCSPEASASF